MPAVNKSKPPSVMTWKKATPILVIGGLFDALRYFFLLFWLLGPALVAGYCTAKVGDIAVIGKLATAGCVAGATALGFGTSAALIAFGTVMAMAVGFAGWFTVVFIIAAKNSRALGDNPFSWLWVFEGLGASVCIMAWGIYKKQIQNDKKLMKKYQKEHTAQQQQEQNQQRAYLMQAQAAQMEQGEIY